MKNYILIYGEDQEFGNMGFRIAGGPEQSNDYNMANGLLIAHDIIEHARIADIGSIGDELKAMGGVWFTRGQLCDFPNSSHSLSDHLASDLLNMCGDFIYGEDFNQPIPNTKEHPCDLDFMDSINKAKKMARSEFDEICPNRWKEYWNNVLTFMRAGYNHSQKRFDRIGGAYAANSLFREIERVVEIALNQAEYEGQQFKLSIDFKNKKAYCDEIFEEY